MQVSPQGLAEIAAHEAIVLSPYLDSVGVWTFGIGHTAAAGSPDPKSFPKGVEQPLSLALETFARDMRKFEDDVNRALRVTVSQTEFDALVSFHFNTGGIARAAITTKLNAGDRAGAAKAFDNWHKPPEIIGRRNAEKRLFETGNYSKGGKAMVYPATAAGGVMWNRGKPVDALSVLAGIRQPPTPPPRPAPSPAPPRPIEDFEEPIRGEDKPLGPIARLLAWLFKGRGR